MDITLSKPKHLFHWLRVYLLYRKAFPASERKPFGIIYSMHRKGRTDLWCIRRGNRFAGFASTVNGENLILLDYLAVDEKKRGTGIGSQILRLMKEHYGDKAVFLEIESVYEECENKAERIRRKHFYEKCGLESMEVFVWLFGVKMELMGFDCQLSYEDYHNFYRDNYNQWAADHIQEAEK